MSFPTKWLLRNGMIQGRVLDYGCGFGKDVEELRAGSFDVIGYDPYYFPEKANEKFDTVLCQYVLNVLEPIYQTEVLMEISRLLKSSGTAYFAVRRDIKYQGYRTHKVHLKKTYQCNVKLPFKSVFTNEFCEIYSYQHFTVLNANNTDISPFFDSDVVNEIIVESASAFSFYDKYPINTGHALVLPKRLVADYFELTQKEQTACWLMVNKVKSVIQEKYNPDGFNIGINSNSAAGQTMPHTHIHVIPRYKGDVQDPRGGVRHVIPNKGNYLK